MLRRQFAYSTKSKAGVGACGAMASLKAISGCGAKSPACFLVEADGARVLLDLGYGPQPGVWPDVSDVGPVDAVLLSHSHRDHAGALKLRSEIGDPPVFATEIVGRLLGDRVDTQPLPLRGRAEVCGLRVTTGRNGHAPGGVWLHLDIGGGLLYMGDCSAESSLYAFDPPPRAQTVILDASYGSYDATLAQCRPEFDRLFEAGPVLLPVPAAGRGPEIALHLATSGHALPHIDDAVRGALTKLVAEDRACLRSEAVPTLERLAREAPDIAEPKGVMLAATGDADAGVAARLVKAWEPLPAPAIVFTGYLPPDTPALRLTQSGRARYMRWNVHPPLADNARLVRETGALSVMPAFGDEHHVAAWQSAFAPAKVVLEGPVAL